MYKLIMVPMLGWPSDRRALQLAFPVARMFRAHLAGIYLSGYGRSVLTDDQTGDLRMARQLVEAARDGAADREDSARQLFLEACEAAGVAVGTDWMSSGRVSASWQTLDEIAALTARAAYADLVCLASAADEGAQVTALRESMLFQAAVPVLHLCDACSGPAGGFPEMPVLLGWNGSPQAMGATRAALPLLRISTAVHVASPEGAMDHANDMVEWLRLQGCRARAFDGVGLEGPAPDLGKLAERCGAGLLVMGAYTHSRLRQQLLGGVTRRVLQEASVPVLLKH